MSDRECSCPEWVIRCAHFPDGRYIGIRKPNLIKVRCSRCPLLNELKWVFGGSYGMSYCPECGSPVWPRFNRIYLENFDSEAGALAAFLEAERRLIDGE